MALKYSSNTNVAWNLQLAPSTANPIDNRTVVATLDDLIKLETWGTANGTVVYKGLQVFCEGNNTTYVYTGEDNKATSVVKQGNWTPFAAGDSVKSIKINYDSAKTELQLTDATGTAFSTIDASAFIKDGMLAGTSVFVATGTTQSVTIKDQTTTLADLTSGRHYIVFLFKVDGKETSYEWSVLDATSIIDVFSASNGIALSDHKFSLVKDTDSEAFLTISDKGIKLSGVQNAIDAAAKKATTTVKASDSHVTVTSTTDATNGNNVYTVATKDVASATELTNEIAARKAVDGQSGQTYTANSSATYIKAATSLNDADLKLDSALSSEANARTAQDDTIEAAVGLSTEGKHISTTGNYTSKATTVVGEIAALDTQVKTLSDTLSSTKVSVATNSTNYLGADKLTISAKTSEINDTATGLATAKAVYDFALTVTASSDTTDYADVF